MRRLTTRVNRLAGRASSIAPFGCETYCDWTPRVFVTDHQLPRGEECAGCGRRVPIRLLRIYDLVDVNASDVELDHAASEKLVPITRE